MRLKRVKIFGFKTFAEKTELILDGDIIAIVGPNGCGKSNIVDAILWGLGEPNSRNLRAATSLDVIFNGSPKRKPLGYAEVTLVFDNEDGSLPLDAAEVAITRRVTRAGDSHFSINRKTCRLKDIYDLLADSGLGRAGYSIVGQREIDQALSASADDRRSWIDEAAGVQRFRAKRVESVRRMESAKEHLSRIEQILADIEFQREPLRDEAETAKRFLALKSALVQLEVDLLVKEVFEAVSDAEILASRLDETDGSRNRQLALELDLSEKISEAGEVVGDLERKLDAVRELRQSQHNIADRAASNIELIRQRLRSLDEFESNLETEQNTTEGHLVDAESDVAKALAEEQEARALMDAISADQITDAGRAADLQAELTAIDGQLSEAKALQAQAVKKSAEIEANKSRLKMIHHEIAGIEASLPAVGAELKTARENAGLKELHLEEGVRALRELETNTQNQKETEESLRKRIAQIRAELSSDEARARALESTIDSHEGLSQGGSAVMKLVRDGELNPVYTPVAEAFDAHADHATAIETALGGAVHDLIVPAEQHAKQAIQILKERRLGRATFQPLTLVRQNHGQAELRRLTHEKGVVGVASDLVECANEHRPVAESLLGRILVVETLDDSLRLAKTKGWSKIVTLDGEVVFSSGAVAGGRAARAPAGIIHRKAELELLHGRVGHSRELMGEIEVALVEVQRELEGVKLTLRSQQDALATLSTEKVEAEKWAHGLQTEWDSSCRDRDRLIREADSLKETPLDPSFAPVDLHDLGERRDTLLSSLSALRAELEARNVRVKDAQRRLEEAVARKSKAEERILTADEKREARAERKRLIVEERLESTDKLTEHEQERERALCELSKCETEIAEVTARRQSALEASYAVSDELKRVQQQIRDLEQAIHRLEVERARLDSRRTAAVERLLEEYSLTEADAMSKGPTVQIPEDAGQIVGRLRRDIRALGDVNVGAIEAFERLTQRFSELDLQRQDVQESLDEIQGAVRELDRLTRDKFLATFEQVRDAFRSTFTELFGGGQADLSLTNTEQVLTAGVDVEVTLPGKKRQRLELLSGGERSMSAVAFLFALLRVKPSPLVVLDEVDAPLDGRNVERYISVLKSCTDRTQFLVITHNPVTIEAAPVWFGVTMQEPGCTSVIPCRLPNDSDVLQDVVHEAFLIN